MKLFGNSRVCPRRVLLCVAGLFTALAVLAKPCFARTPKGASSASKATAGAAKAPSRVIERQAAALADFGKLPLAFEPNRGQACQANEADCRIQFLSHGPGYTLFLMADGAVLKLESRSQSSVVSGQLGKTTDHVPRTTDVVRLTLVGANPAAPMTGLDELPGKSNYFLGSDPSKWLREIPN